MIYEEHFSDILDKDEKILETFKPHKFRSIGLTIIRNAVMTFFVLLFLGLFALIPYLTGDGEEVTCSINGVQYSGDECGAMPELIYIIPLIICGLVLVGFLFSLATCSVRYKKTFFCCTNKRIIIRTGFIGADYQTLDYDLIGGMDVKVDFLDKICKPNTGTITFASAASPMVEKTSSYHFFHIEDPYQAYKRIKEYSANCKDGKLNS